MLLQLQYGLKIFFWFIRFALVIFILIPGSVPALIVAFLTYLLRLIDPNQLFLEKGQFLYESYILALPLLLRQVIVVGVGLLLLTIFVRRELQRLEDPNILKSFKIKFDRIYERYLRFPSE